MWGLWTAARYGGCRRPWGSTATVQIYRIVIVGVLCSQILLASLDRTPYEVNTFTSLKEVHYVHRSAYNWLCAQATPIALRQVEKSMSSKPSDNDDRYKALGFESTFDGSAGGIQWSDLVEELKTNLLRQDLRVRKFIMGEYDTKVGERELAKVPTPLPADWDATVKGLWRYWHLENAGVGLMVSWTLRGVPSTMGVYGDGADL